MTQTERDNIISAVELAAVSNVSNLTDDRVQALTGGHGMLNIAVHTVANVITEELLKGRKLSIEFADVKRLPVADIMERAIKTAKESGADGANAALITACIMYLAGSAAQVGIPAGNRKLGATARMLAGVDRSGVAAIPTAKKNSKISAFPAVSAIYRAMEEGRLTSFDGRKIPENVSGSALYGHSALGEDFVWPEMAKNGARIGTEAMIKAYAGAGITPELFICAVFGAAAILEIIHPDAEVPESEGTYGRTSSVYLVGRAAAETAGLPKTLHMRVTGAEFETAKLVGDVGLILKDIGAPSVIGMMAFEEIFSIFRECISGASGGRGNSPLGHCAGYAITAMKTLLAYDGDVEKTMAGIVKEKMENSKNPEVGLMSINIIARKAHEVHPGPVTDLLINATDPGRAYAIHWRTVYTLDELEKGTSLEDIVRYMDNRRIEETCKFESEYWTEQTGEPVTIKVRRLASGARRTSKLALKYWSFDPLLDVTVTQGDKTAVMDGFVHDIIPRTARGELPELAWAVPMATTVGSELVTCGCSNLNIVIPAAVAAAAGVYEPKEAAGIAEGAAFLTRAIPGGKMAATKVGKLAKSILDFKIYEGKEK